MDEYFGHDSRWHSNEEGESCLEWGGHDFILEPPIDPQRWDEPPLLYCDRCKFSWRVEEA